MSYRALQIQAQSKVQQAVKNGQLYKPLYCTYPRCFHEKNIQAHHYKGYEPEYQLDVQWLCSSHHQFLEYHPDQNPALYGSSMAVS